MKTPRRITQFAASILCVATLMVTSGCGGERPEPAPVATPIASLSDQDLLTFSGEAATAARLGIEQALGEKLASNLTPISVYALGKYHLVLSRDMSSASFVQADLADATGKVWTRELAFNAEWDLSDISLGSHAEVNHPVLVITLEAPADVTPAASRFYIAITANDGLLVRALNPQRLIADNLISDQHPELIIDRGNISDDDSAAQLAALVYFAQPGAKDDRSTARVVGHLEDLAGGTNMWLAEGAALVLTQ